MTPGADGGRGRPWARSWPRAVAVAILIVVVLVVAFAIVPDRLARFAERRSRSFTLRDALLSGWFAVSVVGVSWGLSRLQRRRII